MTREAAVERLLDGYRRYYTITRFDGGFNIPYAEYQGIREGEKVQPPELEGESHLSAFCEYYERNGQHIFFRSNEIWSSQEEEFIFLFNIPHMTKELFEKCRDYCWEEGRRLAHIGPGHMYTYISPIFVCDTMDDDAAEALAKSKLYKSFKFSFHGWMELHTACFPVKENRLHFNRAGRCMEKNIKYVLKNFLQ